MKLPWLDLKDEDENLGLIRLVKPLLPTAPRILEAGACDCTDSIRFTKTWPECYVYAFEPYAEHVNNAFGRNRIGQNLQVLVTQCALGATNGVVDFYYSHSSPGASGIYPDNLVNIDIPEYILDSTKGDRNSIGYKDQKTEVTIRRADSFPYAQGKPEFAWLDAEGSELEILKGASLILPGIRVIAVEVNFKEFRKGGVLFSELDEFLKEQGFHILHIFGVGKVDWQTTAIYVRR